ncbi:MAG: hypothetical protein ABSF64_08245 [Bryobacteraceae bacterium]|jgi:hypothetical protein
MTSARALKAAVAALAGAALWPMAAPPAAESPIRFAYRREDVYAERWRMYKIIYSLY